MKQYCRYCGSCFEGDAFYCSAMEKIISESTLKRANNCPEYVDCGIDVITGKERSARNARARVPKTDNGSVQIGLEI